MDIDKEEPALAVAAASDARAGNQDIFQDAEAKTEKELEEFYSKEDLRYQEIGNYLNNPNYAEYLCADFAEDGTLTPQTIELLNTYIQPDDKGLEFLQTFKPVTINEAGKAWATLSPEHQVSAALASGTYQIWLRIAIDLRTFLLEFPLDPDIWKDRVVVGIFAACFAFVEHFFSTFSEADKKISDRIKRVMGLKPLSWMLPPDLETGVLYPDLNDKSFLKKLKLEQEDPKIGYIKMYAAIYNAWMLIECLLAASVIPSAAGVPAGSALLGRLARQFFLDADNEFHSNEIDDSDSIHRHITEIIEISALRDIEQDVDLVSNLLEIDTEGVQRSEMDAFIEEEIRRSISANAGVASEQLADLILQASTPLQNVKESVIQLAGMWIPVASLDEPTYNSLVLWNTALALNPAPVPNPSPAAIPAPVPSALCLVTEFAIIATHPYTSASPCKVIFHPVYIPTSLVSDVKQVELFAKFFLNSVKNVYVQKRRAIPGEIKDAFNAFWKARYPSHTDETAWSHFLQVTEIHDVQKGQQELELGKPNAVTLSQDEGAWRSFDYFQCFKNPPSQPLARLLPLAPPTELRIEAGTQSVYLPGAFLSAEGLAFEWSIDEFAVALLSALYPSDYRMGALLQAKKGAIDPYIPVEVVSVNHWALLFWYRADPFLVNAAINCRNRSELEQVLRATFSEYVALGMGVVKDSKGNYVPRSMPKRLNYLDLPWFVTRCPGCDRFVWAYDVNKEADPNDDILKAPDWRLSQSVVCCGGPRCLITGPLDNARELAIDVCQPMKMFGKDALPAPLLTMMADRLPIQMDDVIEDAQDKETDLVADVNIESIRGYLWACLTGTSIVAVDAKIEAVVLRSVVAVYVASIDAITQYLAEAVARNLRGAVLLEIISTYQAEKAKEAWASVAGASWLDRDAIAKTAKELRERQASHEKLKKYSVDELLNFGDAIEFKGDTTLKKMRSGVKALGKQTFDDIFNPITKGPVFELHGEAFEESDVQPVLDLYCEIALTTARAFGHGLLKFARNAYDICRNSEAPEPIDSGLGASIPSCLMNTLKEEQISFKKADKLRFVYVLDKAIEFMWERLVYIHTPIDEAPDITMYTSALQVRNPDVYRNKYIAANDDKLRKMLPGKDDEITLFFDTLNEAVLTGVVPKRDELSLFKQAELIGLVVRNKGQKIKEMANTYAATRAYEIDRAIFHLFTIASPLRVRDTKQRVNRFNKSDIWFELFFKFELGDTAKDTDAAPLEAPEPLQDIEPAPATAPVRDAIAEQKQEPSIEDIEAMGVPERSIEEGVNRLESGQLLLLDSLEVGAQLFDLSQSKSLDPNQANTIKILQTGVSLLARQTIVSTPFLRERFERQLLQGNTEKDSEGMVLFSFRDLVEPPKPTTLLIEQKPDGTSGPKRARDSKASSSTEAKTEEQGSTTEESNTKKKQKALVDFKIPLDPNLGVEGAARSLVQAGIISTALADAFDLRHRADPRLKDTTKIIANDKRAVTELEQKIKDLAQDTTRPKQEISKDLVVLLRNYVPLQRTTAAEIGADTTSSSKPMYGLRLMHDSATLPTAIKYIDVPGTLPTKKGHKEPRPLPLQLSDDAVIDITAEPKPAEENDLSLEDGVDEEVKVWDVEDDMESEKEKRKEGDDVPLADTLTDSQKRYVEQIRRISSHLPRSMRHTDQVAAGESEDVGLKEFDEYRRIGHRFSKWMNAGDFHLWAEAAMDFVLATRKGPSIPDLLFSLPPNRSETFRATPDAGSWTTSTGLLSKGKALGQKFAAYRDIKGLKKAEKKKKKKAPKLSAADNNKKQRTPKSTPIDDIHPITPHPITAAKNMIGGYGTLYNLNPYSIKEVYYLRGEAWLPALTKQALSERHRRLVTAMLVAQIAEYSNKYGAPAHQEYVDLIKGIFDAVKNPAKAKNAISEDVIEHTDVGEDKIKAFEGAVQKIHATSQIDITTGARQLCALVMCYLEIQQEFSDDAALRAQAYNAAKTLVGWPLSSNETVNFPLITPQFTLEEDFAKLPSDGTDKKLGKYIQAVEEATGQVERICKWDDLPHIRQTVHICNMALKREWHPTLMESVLDVIKDMDEFRSKPVWGYLRRRLGEFKQHPLLPVTKWELSYYSNSMMPDTTGFRRVISLVADDHEEQAENENEDKRGGDDVDDLVSLREKRSLLTQLNYNSGYQNEVSLRSLLLDHKLAVHSFIYISGVLASKVPTLQSLSQQLTSSVVRSRLLPLLQAFAPENLAVVDLQGLEKQVKAILALERDTTKTLLETNKKKAMDIAEKMAKDPVPPAAPEPQEEEMVINKKRKKKNPLLVQFNKASTGHRVHCHSCHKGVVLVCARLLPRRYY